MLVLTTQPVYAKNNTLYEKTAQYQKLLPDEYSVLTGTQFTTNWYSFLGNYSLLISLFMKTYMLTDCLERSIVKVIEMECSLATHLISQIGRPTIFLETTHFYHPLMLAWKLFKQQNRTTRSTVLYPVYLFSHIQPDLTPEVFYEPQFKLLSINTFALSVRLAL